MVQYKLVIEPVNAYEWHAINPYWEFQPGVNVPPQWKDVPSCILEEWRGLIPNQFGSSTIGGTTYFFLEELLMPLGQLSHYVVTEHEISLCRDAPRRRPNQLNLRQRGRRRNLALEFALDGPAN